MQKNTKNMNFEKNEYVKKENRLDVWLCDFVIVYVFVCISICVCVLIVG
jgi:hypothetical protein